MFRRLPWRSGNKRTQWAPARRIALEPLEERCLLSLVTESPDLGIGLGATKTLWFDPPAAEMRDDAPLRWDSIDWACDDLGQVTGHLSLSAALLGVDQLGGVDYTSLDIPGWSSTNTIGQAALPVYRTSLIVPNGATVAVNYEVDSALHFDLGRLLAPVQLPESENGAPVSDQNYLFDAAYYRGDVDAYQGVIEVSEPAIVRGTSVVFVNISPFDYDPLTGQLDVFSELTFHLDFAPGDAATAGDASATATAAPAEAVSDSGVDPDYLIITADAFYDAVQPLAQWKQMKGFQTQVVKLSEIGSSSTAIQNYISNSYHTGAATSYVLLVGDYNDVPSTSINSSLGYYISDVPYACVDGSDYFADLAIGRLAVHTTAEATTVVNKILAYDRNPEMGDWYDDALVAGYLQGPPEDDRWFMETTAHVAQYLAGEQDMDVHYALTTDSLGYGAYYYRQSSYPHRFDVVSRYEPFASSTAPPFTIPEWISSQFVSPSAATNQVSAAFNAGVGLVQHRDHGSETGWGDPPFSVANVNALTNGAKTPVVFSTNCLTGAFDYGGGDCFAEALLQNPNGGAVGVVASTEVSYSGYNDLLVHGTYTAFWADYDPTHTGNPYPHTMRPAEALNFGKYYMALYEGSSTYTQTECNEFNWFGDPEMMLRTATPTMLTVSYSDVLVYDVATDLAVTVSGDGMSQAGALVCISRAGTSDYWVGTTDASGQVLFHDLTASALGDYSIVVSGYNLRPYEGLLTAILPGPNPALQSPAATSAVNVDQGFVDIDWRDYSSAGLNAATIDANDIAIAGVAVQAPVHLTGNVWRYSYSGSLTPGEIQVVIHAAEVQDNSGQWNAGGVKSFVYDVAAPSGTLAAGAAGATAFTDLGYLDIQWSDAGEAGVDATTLDAHDIQIEGVNVLDAPSNQGGGVWRYRYSGQLAPGAVNVAFAADEVRDLAGNAAAGHVESFTFAPLRLTSPDDLPTGYLSIPYNTTLTAAGGEGAYHWTVVGASLPLGLTLDADTGLLSGAPQQSGDYELRISVSDSSNPVHSAVMTYHLAINTLPALVLQLPSRAAEGDGRLANQGTVSIPFALQTDLLVGLQVEDGQISLPATVTIAAGATSAAFDVVIDDDALLDGSRLVHVSAAAPGYDPGMSTIVVDDNETATLQVLLPPAVHESDGTLASAGVVELDRIVDLDTTVYLSSSDTSELVVPASVTILAGASSATFALDVVDDHEIDGLQIATVAAHVENWTDGSAPVQVADNESRDLYVSLPPRLWEAESQSAGVGTVSLSGTLSYDLLVTLSASDDGELQLPESVVIPAGMQWASFALKALDDAELDGVQSVTVRASAADFNDGTDTIDIADDDLHHFDIADIAGPRNAAAPFALTITARDINDSLIAVYAGAVQFSAAGDAGAAAISPTTANLAAGTWTGNVAIPAIDTNMVITASDAAGHLCTSNAFDLVAGPATQFEWSAIGSPQTVDVPFTVTITAKDAYGYIATDFTGPADLYGSVATTPVTVGTSTATWNMPLATNGATVRTQSIYLASELGGAGRYTSLALYVGNLPGQTLNNWTIRLKQTPLSSYSEYRWETDGWTTVYENDETISSKGWVTFAFDAPFDYDGVGNLMVDFSFENASAGSNGSSRCTNTGVERTVFGFSNSQGGGPLNWSGTASHSALVPNIQLGRATPLAITPASTGHFVNGVWTGQIAMNEAAAAAFLSVNDGNGRGGSSSLFSVGYIGNLTVSLPTATTEAAGLLAGQGAVSVDVAPTTDLIVSLGVGGSNELALPPTVTILAGHSSATFDLTVLDDAELDGSQSAVVTAKAASYRSTSAAILVHDNETATLSLILPDNGAEGTGLAPGAGRITISQAPAKDVMVRLSSADVSELTVPATVTILAGQTSATFDLTFPEDTLIDGLQSVTVTAHVENWTDGTARLDVLDNESRAITVTLPAKFYENEGVRTNAAVVSVAGTLTSNLVVNLTSSDVSELTVPTSVTILAGSSSAQFSLSLVNDAEYDGVQTVTVTASAEGFSSGSSAMQVADDELHHFTMGAITGPKTANVGFQVSLVAKDVNDATITVFTGTAQMSASGAAGSHGVAPALISGFVSGVRTTSVMINAVDTDVVLTANDGLGHTATSNAFDLVAGPATQFVWSAIGSPQYIDEPFTATITAKDANGYLATGFSGPLSFYENAVEATRTIGTGVTASSSFPLRTSSQDVRTQIIYLAGELGGAGRINSLALDVASLPGQTLKNWTIRIKRTSLNSYSSKTWESTDWTTVYQGDVTISNTGWATFNFSTPFDYDGVSNLMVDFSFDNSTSSTAGAVNGAYSSGTRTIYGYANGTYGSPLNWIGSGSPTPSSSSYVPNIRLGMLVPTPLAAATGSFANGVWTGTITLAREGSGAFLSVRDASAHFGVSNAFDVRYRGDLSLAIPESAHEGDGTLVGQGLVSVSIAPTADLTVNLTRSRADEIDAPTTVTILAGQTSAVFDLAVLDDGDLDGSQWTTVTVASPSYRSDSAAILVHDNETATLTLSLPAQVAEGDGTLHAAATVSLAQAPTKDVTVQLSSSNGGELTVPATVTILAGQTSATFDLGVLDDTVIDGAQSVSVTAHVENWSDGTARVDVLDNERHDLAVSMPGKVYENQGTLAGIATVSLSGTVLHDLVVSLSSSDESELRLPATITILAGQSSATFDLQIVDDADDDGIQSVAVTASAAEFTDGVAAIAIADNELHHFSVSNIAGPKTAAVPFAVTIAAKDINDATIDIYAGGVQWSAAGQAGAATISPTTTVLTAGVWSGNLAINAVDTQVVLTATDGAGHGGASNAFDLTPGPTTQFQWSEVGSQQVAGVPFDVTITARDANGFLATDFNGQLDLAGRLVASQNVEIGSGTSNWPLPFYTAMHDARTQVIFLKSQLGAAGRISALALDVTGVPGQTLGNWTIRVKPTTLSSYSTYAWESSGWTTVYQSNLTISSTGWVTFDLATPFDYDGVSNLMVDFSFNNSSSSSSSGSVRASSASPIRTLFYYTNSSYGDPLNWSGTSAPIPSASGLVPNMRFLKDGPVAITPSAPVTFVNGVWSGQVSIDSEAAAAYLVATDAAGHVGRSNQFSVSYIGDLSISMPEAATEGDGTLQGLVSVSVAPLADLTVQLTTSDATELLTPHPVTILAGQLSAAFEVTVVDDAGFDGNQSGTVSASATSYRGASRSMLVRDNDTATLSVSLPAAVTEGNGILTGVGTVSINAAAAKNVTVYLSSNDTSELTVPASVTILAGQTSAHFNVTVVDDTYIDGVKSVQITAHVDNWIDGTARVDVLDNEDARFTVVLPTKKYESEGTLTTATVSLNGPVESPLVVYLVSSDTTELTVPETVTILAGQSAAYFSVTLVNDQECDGLQTVTVTASAGGFIVGSSTMQVADDDVHHFLVGAIGSSKTAATPFNISLTAKNIDDATITVFAGTAQLSASGAAGPHAVTPAVTTAFTAGVWNGSVAIQAVDTAVVLTASDGAGHSGASNAFNLVAGPVTQIEMSAIASPQIVGVPFTATLTAMDANGFVATGYNGTISLSGNVGPTSVDTGSGTVPWSTPLDGYWSAVRTQSIYLASELGGRGKISSLALNLSKAPGNTLKNFTIRIKQTSLSEYASSAFDSTGWITVYQSNASFSGTGWKTFNLSTPFDYDGTSNLLVDISFNNGSTGDATSIGTVLATSTSEYRTLSKFSSGSLGDPLNWTSPATREKTVANLRLGRSFPVHVDPNFVNFVNGVWTGPITVNDVQQGVVLFAASSGITIMSNRFDVQDQVALSLSLPNSAREGDGTLVNQGLVSLNKARSTNLVVSLTHGGPTELSLPSTVTILAGQLSAAFNLTVLDDADLDGSQTVTVTASAAGCRSGSDTIRVDDNDSAVLTVAVPATVTEGDDVLVGAGRVSIDRAPTANFTVQLSSSDTSAVAVPATVTILAGQTSATFNLTVVDDLLLDSTQSAVVKAHVEGWTDGTARVDVLDNESRNITVSLPAKFYENQGLRPNNATVSLAGAVASDLIVYLASSDTSELAVPASVTILAGRSWALFDLTAVNDALCDGVQTVTVTASAAGFNNGAASMQVADDDVHHFSFGSIVDPQFAPTPFNVSLTAKDVNDATITVFTGTAQLSASGAAGPHAVWPTATTAFTAGTWTGSVVISAADTDVVLVASDGAGHSGASNRFDVLGDTLAPRVANVLVRGSSWSSSFLSHLASLDARNVDGYAIPVATSQQLTTLPWTNINQIKIVFSEDVLVDQADLALFGANTPRYDVAGGTFGYDAATYTATWNLPTAIAADALALRLNADGADPIRDRAGNRLDGDAASQPNAYLSGNGTAGGDFVCRFNVVPGDVDGNQGVNLGDYLQDRAKLGQLPGSANYNLRYDVDGNGGINLGDALLCRARVGYVLPSGQPATAAFPAEDALLPEMSILAAGFASEYILPLAADSAPATAEGPAELAVSAREPAASSPASSSAPPDVSATSATMPAVEKSASRRAADSQRNAEAILWMVQQLETAPLGRAVAFGRAARGHLGPNHDTMNSALAETDDWRLEALVAAGEGERIMASPVGKKHLLDDNDLP